MRTCGSEPERAARNEAAAAQTSKPCQVCNEPATGHCTGCLACPGQPCTPFTR